MASIAIERGRSKIYRTLLDSTDTPLSFHPHIWRYPVMSSAPSTQVRTTLFEADGDLERFISARKNFDEKESEALATMVSSLSGTKAPGEDILDLASHVDEMCSIYADGPLNGGEQATRDRDLLENVENSVKDTFKSSGNDRNAAVKSCVDYARATIDAAQARSQASESEQRSNTPQLSDSGGSADTNRGKRGSQIGGQDAHPIDHTESSRRSRRGSKL
jgi:hypothetical protein